MAPVTTSLRPPFTWFGGKRRVGPVVWRAFGHDVPNYVEPFFGSGAVLLGRPGGAGKIETVNDLDGGLVNAWRALRSEPEAVAEWCEWPVSELDLTARHAWLIARLRTLRDELAADPYFCDAKVAGWWIWGINQWIGSGWCKEDARPQLPSLNPGSGIRSQRSASAEQVRAWFASLSRRMRRVRITCGDWERVVSPASTGVGNTLGNMGMTPCAVFLDPPYEGEGDVFATAAGASSAEAREWAIANGANERLRIALCGYEGEHSMPESWTTYEWKASGGYANQSGVNENAARERIWFSPHCLPLDEQPSLFPEGGAR